MRMDPEHLAQIRDRLNKIEWLLVELSVELKMLRERLHAAAPVKELQKS